jgi:hypothetical protein
LRSEGRLRNGGKGNQGWRGLTTQLGTANRAAVHFFDPVGRGPGAVVVCAEMSTVLARMAKY